MRGTLFGSLMLLDLISLMIFVFKFYFKEEVNEVQFLEIVTRQQ